MTATTHVMAKMVSTLVLVAYPARGPVLWRGGCGFGGHVHKVHRRPQCAEHKRCAWRKETHGWFVRGLHLDLSPLARRAGRGDG